MTHSCTDGLNLSDKNIFVELGRVDIQLGGSVDLVDELLAFAAAWTVGARSINPCAIESDRRLFKDVLKAFQLALIDWPQVLKMIAFAASDIALAGINGLKGCHGSYLGDAVC
jgi:hypothetical protein